MKLLLFILALTFYQTVSAQLGNWTLVTPEILKNNTPYIQDLMAWGVQELAQEEVSAGRLPEATYESDQVHSIVRQYVIGINYRYDVDIKNDLGWVLRATFVVYNQSWTNTKELKSYAYEVTENPDGQGQEEFAVSDEENIPGGYSSVDPSEVDTNQQLKDALDYGVMTITEQAVTEHHLPESDEYDVVEIHSIYEQVVNGMNYRFDVSLQNCAGLVARAVFTVYSQAGTDTLEATQESLDVTEVPEEGLIGCVEASAEEENYFVEEEENNDDLGGEQEPFLEDSQLGFFGGWNVIDLNFAANYPKVQELQQFGADYVIDQAVQDGRLPDTTYEISNVYSVESENVPAESFRFDVELKACNGLTARAKYDVYEDDSVPTKTVTLTSLGITSAPNGPVMAGCPSS